MTKDDLRLVIDDTLAALPANMSGGDVASILASIAASYSKTDQQALMHLQTAALLVSIGRNSA